MFVRFRSMPRRRRLQLSLVCTRRRGTRSRQFHIAALGTVAWPASTADRLAFWYRLDRRIERVPSELRDHVIASIAKRIPPVTAAERRAILDTTLIFVRGRLDERRALRQLAST